MIKRPVTLFLSYAHEDEQLLRELEKHLSLLKRQGFLLPWHDRQIRAGEHRTEMIDEQLEQASIILLLISADFLASDYCYGIEMQRALERHNAGHTRVIPIFLRPVDWESAPFTLTHLQGLPRDGKAITEWINRDLAFREIVQGIRQATEGRSSQPTGMLPAGLPQNWNIPYPRNPFFTGREKILLRIHRQLQSGQATALSQPQAINGLGGIGKTQIAVEYAYSHRNRYQYVFWVKSDKREELISDFIAIAGFLNLPEKNVQDQAITVGAVKRWLQSHADWLLIFDNADDLRIIGEYLPLGGKGHIILTTRAQAMGGIARRIEIDKMGMQEGALFLLRRANIVAPDDLITSVSAADFVDAKEIIQALDGLPLALDQAGAYIEETACGLSGYLRRYQTQRVKLLKRRGGVSATHPEPVATTWQIAFQKVEQANPAAADLLRLCAFLSPDAIPEEIITKGASDLPLGFQSLAFNPIELDAALEELHKFSLVRRNPDDQTLVIHRLVQSVLKDEMSEEMHRQWADRAVRAVSQAFPSVRYETWLECQRCLPHAQVCASLIKQWNLAFPEAAQLLSQAGEYLYERAQYRDAELLCRHALVMREKVLGTEHPKVAISLNNLAILYKQQQKYAQANSLCQHALAIRKKVLGSEHPEVADSLNELAVLARRLGNHAEAEQLHHEALSIRERALGLEHLDVATSLNNLGTLYDDQGKYTQAENLYQRALAIREKALGSEHPTVATSLNNLAFLYQNQGKYTQAEDLYQRAIVVYEKTIGPEHPHMAVLLANYTYLLHQAGRKDEAMELEVRARAIHTRRRQEDAGSHEM